MTRHRLLDLIIAGHLDKLRAFLLIPAFADVLFVLLLLLEVRLLQLLFESIFADVELRQLDPVRTADQQRALVALLQRDVARDAPEPVDLARVVRLALEQPADPPRVQLGRDRQHL